MKGCRGMGRGGEVGEGLYRVGRHGEGRGGREERA